MTSLRLTELLKQVGSIKGQTEEIVDRMMKTAQSDNATRELIQVYKDPKKKTAVSGMYHTI